MGRRAMGLAALVLMANATFASAAWACASAMAGAPAPSGHRAHEQGSGRATGQHQGDAPTPRNTPCSVPSGLDCCGAVTPCGVSLLVANTVAVAALEANGTVHTPFGLRAPTSPVTSPDPPPPKA